VVARDHRRRDEAQAHVDAAAKSAVHSDSLKPLAEAEANLHTVIRNGIEVLVAWKDLTTAEILQMYAWAAADSDAAAAQANLNAILKESEHLAAAHTAALHKLDAAMSGGGSRRAEQIQQAYADSAKAAEKALDSMIAAANKPTTVTAEDQILTQMGLYVDKFDEARRRLDTIKNAGRITGTDDIPRMFGLLPADVQKQLQDAANNLPQFSPAVFAGLPKGIQDAVRGSFDSMPAINPDTFSKLSPELQKAINADLQGKAIKIAAIKIEQEQGGKLIDAEKLADAVMADLDKVKENKALQEKVKSILKARGVDTNDPELQKSLGIETGAEKAVKINAQMDFSAGQVVAAAREALAKASEMVGLFKFSPAIATSVVGDQEGFTMAGKKIAPPIVRGLSDYLELATTHNQMAASLVKSIGDAQGYINFGMTVGQHVVKGVAKKIDDEAAELSGALYNAFKHASLPRHALVPVGFPR